MEVAQIKPHSPVCLGVLTADPLRLDGLRALLEVDGTYQVVALSAGDRADAPAPSLAMVDTLAVLHLEALIRQLRKARPQVPILILGPEASPDEIMAFLSLGAKGFLSYRVGEAELRMALQVVLDGSVWAPRKVLSLLLASKVGAPNATPKLTPREDEVLGLLLQGHSNRRLAEALGVDEATIKAHLGRLMRKLGVSNRIALTIRAMDKLRASGVDE